MLIRPFQPTVNTDSKSWAHDIEYCLIPILDSAPGMLALQKFD